MDHVLRVLCLQNQGAHVTCLSCAEPRCVLHIMLGCGVGRARANPPANTFHWPGAWRQWRPAAAVGLLLGVESWMAAVCTVLHICWANHEAVPLWERNLVLVEDWRCAAWHQGNPVHIGRGNREDVVYAAHKTLPLAPFHQHPGHCPL